MINFLINKPIAVTMTFIAILTLGLVASRWLPVSLMPDVDIPRITVHISSEGMPARELENSIVGGMRRQLLQVQHLEDIRSETRDGSAVISMDFSYGSNIDFAFIEANEKIDRAMSYLPKETQRPRVIKASATDIPVFYLNLTLKERVGSQQLAVGNGQSAVGSQSPAAKASGDGSQLTVGSRQEAVGRRQSEKGGVMYSNNMKQSETTLKQPETTLKQPETILKQPETIPNNSKPTISQQFTHLSNFAAQVIRKRIEQLPEVAIADISGQVFPEILILPDMSKLQSLNLTTRDIENAIIRNNINPGNLVIRDGQYQYNVRFDNALLNRKEIENIYLKSESRLLQLKDLCEVIEQPEKQKGKVVSDGQDAITMAIIKQSDARMADLRDNLHSLINRFKRDYPDIEFTVTRDQTALLDYSINNLKQSLLIGGLLAFLVMFLFLKDVRSPILIGITIPSSLIISLLFFYISGLSLNIISLSGLILGIGMMIDNSIIVIDNITQFRERGHPLNEACVLGTNEVFRPMLSSVLTTCAVFIPLIFIGGISGALFYDQAIAITIGLFVSLGVSVTLLPVYYRLAYLRGKGSRGVKWLRKINRLDYERIYEKGFRFTMRHQPHVWVAVALMLGLAYLLYIELDKEKMPPLTRADALLEIDWNDRITVEENNSRVRAALRAADMHIIHYTSLIGQQEFLMEHGTSSSVSRSGIYFQTKRQADLDEAKGKIQNFLRSNYPEAIYEFETTGNIFDMIFAEKQAPLVLRLRATEDFGPEYNNYLQNTMQEFSRILSVRIPPISWQEQVLLKADKDKLILYKTDQARIVQALKNAFSENQVLQISGNQNFIPVKIGDDPKTLEEIINTTMVLNDEGEPIRLASFFSIETDRTISTIVAGQEGEYYPVPLEINDKEVIPTMETVNRKLTKEKLFEAGFSGSFFSNREMIRNLVMILMISLLLLYFILASQFESLRLPFIVLLEVPIDIFGALLFLKLFGGSINLMSLIGIVVMSGIIINDSILKVDTIHKLHQKGMPVMKALLLGGQRRLKPILMTSLTTILALLPFLFIEGMGSDLQKPLALAVIGGMIVGTAVSLYFVPLGYYYLKRRV